MARFNVISSLVIYFSCFHMVSSLVKPYRLSLLSFVPITSFETSKAECCMASANLAVDNANARNDILPDYRIDVSYIDEGKIAHSTPRGFFRYLDDLQRAKMNDSSVFISPVMTGPATICNVIAPVIQYHKIITFSSTCTGIQFTKRRSAFPSVYRVRAAFDNVIAPFILAIQKVGRWNQIALMVTTANQYDVDATMLFYRKLLDNGVEVVHFDGGPDYTMDMVVALKRSKARVVFISSSVLSSCLLMICYAYRVGIRAPHYAFVTSLFCFIDPEIELTCEREILLEQAKIIFYVGALQSPIRDHGYSSLGYNATMFEIAFAKIRNRTNCADVEQRYPCHDTMMAAIVTLNMTESALRKTYNKTLKDFETQPELVSKVTNESAASLDFQGLRIGRVSYSKRLEVDNEEIYMVQRFGSANIRLAFKFVRIDSLSESPFNLSNFKVIPVQGALWQTKNGKPPKDLSQIAHLVTDNYPIEATAVSAALCLAVTSFQMTLIAKIIHSKYKLRSNTTTIYFDAASVFIMLIGCIAINLSALCLVLGTTYFPEDRCVLQLVFIFIGIALTNSTLFMKMLTLPRLKRFFSPGKSISRRRLYQFRAFFMDNRIPDGGMSVLDWLQSSLRLRRRKRIRTLSESFGPKSVQLLTKFGIGITLLLTVLIEIIWLGIFDPLAYQWVISPLMFDVKADTYFDLKIESCYGRNQLYWLAGFLVFHAFLLLSAAILAYETRKLFFSPIIAIEFRIARLATVNASILFIGGLLMLGVVTVKDHQQLQAPVFTACVMIYSASTSIIASYPILARKWPVTQTYKRNHSDELQSEVPNASSLGPSSAKTITP